MGRGRSKKTKQNPDLTVPKPAIKRVKDIHELDPEKIEETLNQCPDIITTETGLQKIPPYYINRFAFVKGRWIGKTLKEVYEKEFSSVITMDTVKYRNLKING